jgi:hypothetical protein
MPRNPRDRRARARRRLPPRPTGVAPAPHSAAVAQTASLGSSPSAQTRPQRLVERESRYLGTELRRIGGVAAVCLSLLALLIVVDRLG